MLETELGSHAKSSHISIQGGRISVVVLAFTGASPSQIPHHGLESCIKTGMTSKGQIAGVPTLGLLSQNLGFRDVHSFGDGTVAVFQQSEETGLRDKTRLGCLVLNPSRKGMNCGVI